MHTPIAYDHARKRATIVHLAASVIIVGGILAVPRLLWYPGVLWQLSGIDRHLLLLFAAVLVVGPALTWLVYRTGKRTLRMDVTVVALIQLLFLSYAVSMLARLRPVFLVGTPTHIELVRALDIDPEDLGRAPEERRRLSWTGPALVATAPPGGMMLFGNEDYARRPAYYFDYSKMGPILAGRGRPSGHVGQEDLRAVPLISHIGRAEMLVEANSGAPVMAISGGR